MMPDVAGAALLLSGSPELSLLAKATAILAVGIGVTHIARTALSQARKNRHTEVVRFLESRGARQ